MYLDKEETRVGSVEQDEWVKVTVGTSNGRWLSEGGQCPWHIALAKVGFPVYKDQCSVDTSYVHWADGHERSRMPEGMRMWVWKNDNDKDLAPISVWVNRRTLEIRDES